MTWQATVALHVAKPWARNDQSDAADHTACLSLHLGRFYSA